ncbi:transglutaminase-like cysteine peptidase [Photobacterium sp. 1_MG-2023]|uniref:transglutaminase-like cysteine peptidase n=1 Tax=Photobacterium sp. 1_MG-2023 TaxID=3062646 RepID=UPI0026E427F7|nr:transglutaminase-like cysteine peptidase [Photobacterium sp. 1_MG-2023]MDO6706047.1 transglutaminase-like cysteine peptidase [Photobacterium sp. 1_MG-2023]
MKQWLLIGCLLFASPLNALNEQELAAVTRVADYYGERAGKRMIAWRQLLTDVSAQQETAKLEAVNRFFNQLHFVDDIQLWGETDYWATPLEFIGAAGGDCEDFTIAKYFSLRELGVADEKLRLVYVKALTLNQFHMVLAYYSEPHAVPVLLDNLIPEIKQATERQDLKPVYSFNASQLWLVKQQGQGQLAGKASRLKRWTNLRQRFDSQQMHKPIIHLDQN